MASLRALTRLLVLFLCLAIAPAAAFDLRRLTLEELMELNVYSVSRRDETVRAAPAAVYVLTAEDIRRARVLSVPEALRLVPGVHVARVDANKWAVSIRGFNERAANKLQVMVDGRTIYDPLFSGVLWESRDLVLANIERIEVIRGPGGTLWGANAVNGVINIVTKHSRDTLGGYAFVGGGTEERAFGGVRYGWQAERHSARVSAKLINRDQGFSPTGNAADDALMGRVGYRWDWDPGDGHEIMLSGDLFDGRAGEYRPAGDGGGLPGAVDAEHRGGNVLLNWRRRLGQAGAIQARTYYERFRLDNPSVLREDRDIFHAEFQHDVSLGTRHEVVWGASYRHTQDEITNTRTFSFDPSSRTDQVVGAFVQDTISLGPRSLQLTLGTKVEHNDYTGTEWQPNARLLYLASDAHAWWGAISRAVRTPSRLEADIALGGARIGDAFDVERLTAYEVGHRWAPRDNWSIDSTVFYNVYDDLRTLETTPALAFRNEMYGETYGFEVSNRWQFRPDLRFDIAYSYLRVDMQLKPGSTDTGRPAITEGTAPRHTLAVRTEWDASRDVEFEATLRFVDELPGQPPSVGAVPAYLTIDLGLGYRVGRGVDVSLVGRNLLDPHHPEQATPATATETQRGFYGRLNWRF